MEVPGVRCLAGRGLEGDRYLDHQPDFKGQVTFFSWEVLRQLWDELGLPSDQRNPAATRRNVIVEGVELNGLIGQEFDIQGVRFFGTEECRPCYWMNQAIHPQAEAWMKGRGGLRAKILNSGFLRIEASENLAAALIAGGASRRMGTDKALLAIAGQTLWQRQLAVLERCTPRIAVVAPQQPVWLPSNIPWVEDAPGACGPLAGLLAGLRWAETQGATHLLALAVDLPQITSGHLLPLLRTCPPDGGVVPHARVHSEPLAAVYPVSAIPALENALTGHRWKLQDVLGDLTASGIMQAAPISTEEPFFNLNTPDDLAKLTSNIPAL
ncbi:MAG: hypothetical protein OHK005_00460 [Candidatus Methylacidiphilales bacterium]